MTAPSHPPIRLIGAPTDVGAGARGASMGPEALRVAGLVEALRDQGADVHDAGNLTGPPNPWQPPVNGFRHLPEVAVWNQAVHEAVFDALQAGQLPILLAAAYVPRNQIKARLHHPMVLAVKLWAFGHLLATAKLADVVLFGAFLLWAILDFRAARQRDRALGTVYAPGTVGGTLIAVVVGVVAWAAFAFWLHAAWIGVAPLGRTL